VSITSASSDHVSAADSYLHRWAIFTYSHNMGETSRAIAIGKLLQRMGHPVKFFIHGGHYMNSISEAGLIVEALQPEYTDEQDKALMALDQHRVPLGTPLPFADDQLKAMVEANITALGEYKPDAVFCGLDITSYISAQYLNLPFVTFIPTPHCPAFFEQGLASFPNAMETNPIVRYLIPSFVKNWLLNRIMLGNVAKKTAAVYNRVRKSYGLMPVYNFPALVRGDLTILPDLPELSRLEEKHLPPGYVYTGPVFAMMDMPVPIEVKKVFARPGRRIYLAMGSSGSPELLKKICCILRSVPAYNVVCATTSILAPEELGPASENFFATRFLPAHIVNEMAEIAVLHGGQGTIQTAAWCGTPLVGVGMQWEQQANIDSLAKFGMGVRIPSHSVTRKRLLSAIAVVSTEEAKSRAKEMQAIVRSCDGVRNAVMVMNRYASQKCPPNPDTPARQTVAPWHSIPDLKIPR
jgi:UDP:flavonoid glycosyltransferase YjiC (YdhE family)